MVGKKKKSGQLISFLSFSTTHSLQVYVPFEYRVEAIPYMCTCTVHVCRDDLLVHVPNGNELTWLHFELFLMIVCNDAFKTKFDSNS